MTPRSLKLLSSMATRELLAELAVLYEQRCGRRLVTEAAGGVDVARRVEGGEAMDLVVLAGGAIDKLIAGGRLVAGSRVDLVKSGIAMAVRGGAARPAIGSEAAVRDAVLGARTLSYSTGPSGVYLEALFERWGILEGIRGRIVVPAPGVPVASLVAAGAAELGFQQMSELTNIAGVEVLGPLPAEIQSLTTFAGALSRDCGAADEARAALSFLASPDVADIKRRYGMESA